MLEKPPIPDEQILACLHQAYHLLPREIVFLPLGADMNTAVYRVNIPGKGDYFLKLRLGNLEKFIVELPIFLQALGVEGIIAPIPTLSGEPCAELGETRLILYPFVDGQDGYEVELRDEDWIRLGRIMRRVHNLEIPKPLKQKIASEEYSPHYRNSLCEMMTGQAKGKAADDLAASLAVFLKRHEMTIQWLINQAEERAVMLRARPRNFVLCHADLHAGNVFIDRQDHSLYVIDWDDPVLAPKERDLMFPGGAQGFRGHSPEQEEALFFQGYGEVQVDRNALVYYRCERVIEDLALFGEVIQNSEDSPRNREQAFMYLKSNFDPGGTIERALSLHLESG